MKAWGEREGGRSSSFSAIADARHCCRSYAAACILFPSARMLWPYRPFADESSYIVTPASIGRRSRITKRWRYLVFQPWWAVDTNVETLEYLVAYSEVGVANSGESILALARLPGQDSEDCSAMWGTYPHECNKLITLPMVNLSIDAIYHILVHFFFRAHLYPRSQHVVSYDSKSPRELSSIVYFLSYITVESLEMQQRNEPRCMMLY